MKQVNLVLVMHDQCPHVLEGITPNANVKNYVLHPMETDSTFTPLCKWKNNNIIYVKKFQFLPHPKLVAVDINPKNRMIEQLDSSAFYALKVFALKSKFAAIADQADQVHGTKQRDMWYKVIGLMEPIFAGGWL